MVFGLNERWQQVREGRERTVAVHISLYDRCFQGDVDGVFECAPSSAIVAVS